MGKTTTFRRVVLCHTDDFPAKKNDKIQGWVEHHGGSFTKILTPEVTHLVCSNSAWKDKRPIVREARRQKKTKIVNFDWLEDSLLSATQKPKDTRNYEMDRSSAKKVEKMKVQKVEKEKKVDKCLEDFRTSMIEFERLTGQTGYHVYVDSTHFSHAITLVRADILKNKNEYHHLKLFESNALPHRYMSVSKYSTKGKTGTAEISPIGSNWDVAFAGFKKFFKLKTGVEWEARLERKDSCCVQGNGDGGCDEHFRYQTPKAGRSVGLVKQMPSTERHKTGGNPSGRKLGEVTLLLPSVEIADSDLDCSARTPEGGW